ISNPAHRSRNWIRAGDVTRWLGRDRLHGRAATFRGHYFLQDSAHVIPHVLHLLITVTRIFFDRAIDNLLQPGRQRIATHFSQRLGRVVQDSMTDINRALAAEWPGAGYHLVQQNAGRKNVRALVHSITASLLGRRVSRSAVRYAYFG